ncbi:MAG: right-handed parallel beta-helix repeat-containing protein, partial [Anaerolineae bacterium]|nr:right-handed parallel beta-helix repeat-containing protein [Anaerolineae bacterium]
LGNRLRGIMFEGANGVIEHNTVTGINQGASGCQEGNAIEVRNFGAVDWTPFVKIRWNVISDYQKTGIVTNGNVQVQVNDNIVTGVGPIGYIAQNGIQIGYGAQAIVMRNQVSGNSYTGTSTVSGGIIVVGGPYYGEAYTVGTQIVGNTVTNNDIGIFLSNLAADGGAPATDTNVKVVNNIISSSALQNHYGGFGYQAGISDVGNNDKMINNTISGAGYDPAANPTAYTVAIDADPSFTDRPKVHANDISG